MEDVAFISSRVKEVAIGARYAEFRGDRYICLNGFNRAKLSWTSVKTVSQVLEQPVSTIRMAVTCPKAARVAENQKSGVSKHFSLDIRGENFSRIVGVACHFLGLS